jgi:hypothetical protein
VNLKAYTGCIALGAAFLAAPAAAEQFGPLEVAGFVKEEFSRCDNCSPTLVNPSSFDPRGVLTNVNPPLNQGGETRTTTANLGLAMLTLGLSHEFDNAVKIQARGTSRVRNGGPDIFGHYMIDMYVGVSHPTYGSLDIGKMSTRSWTRSDSFAYPVGLSSAWAESGAGYGLVPEAIRYATREFEMSLGKIRFEATLGRADKRPPINPASSTVAPPSPRMTELFVQFSNEKNLVELIYQDTKGGRQSSFAKGAFYGAQGNTNGPAAATGYRPPSETLLVLQGNHWFNPAWKLSYGIKRSEWSGQQQQCDYGPVSAFGFACYWDQAGFNYAVDQKLYKARETDYMAGVSYTRNIWTFTAGMVRMGKAKTENPTEWGQSNTATFSNVGVYRKVPEIYKNLEAYAGFGRVDFGRQGPAPLSMPNNTAFFGADPRIAKSANGITIGANLKF